MLLGVVTRHRRRRGGHCGQTCRSWRERDGEGHHEHKAPGRACGCEHYARSSRPSPALSNRRGKEPYAWGLQRPRAADQHAADNHADARDDVVRREDPVRLHVSAAVAVWKAAALPLLCNPRCPSNFTRRLVLTFRTATAVAAREGAKNQRVAKSTGRSIGATSVDLGAVTCAVHEQTIEFELEIWRRRPVLNRGWRFCRPYRVVNRGAWLRLLVADDAWCYALFGPCCSELAPKSTPALASVQLRA
jgi:hypothetical protein